MSELGESAYANLRRALIRRRYELEFTQARVAKLMGTTQSAVSDLERGRTADPCMKTIAKWAHALDLEVTVGFRTLDGTP